ncbi:NADH-quinone oxidoreductase subunit G, partial [Acidithiobacillus ferrooxidans]
PLTQPAVVKMHPDQVGALALQGDFVEISTPGGKACLPLVVDARIPMGTVWVPMGYAETATLGAAYTACSVSTATPPATATGT